MKNIIIKLILTLIGLLSFIYCITGEVNGVGRFALILFGTVFVLLGAFKKNNK